MTIKQVFLIYYLAIPAIESSKLYYACNTEWNFEIREAYPFQTEELARIAINRLQGVNAFELQEQYIDPNSLLIESAYLDVDEYLLFQF